VPKARYPQERLKNVILAATAPRNYMGHYLILHNIDRYKVGIIEYVIWKSEEDRSGGVYSASQIDVAIPSRLHT
jgi:hypothetical protein